MAESCATTGPDTRNLRWKENNKGSTLLQKMGWKHGQALGSKKRRSQAGSTEEGEDTTATQEEPHCSGEGLKIVKRAAGLGLGMSQKHLDPNQSISHGHFSQVLAALQVEHSMTSKNSKKSKKRSRKDKEESEDSSSSKDDDDDDDEKEDKKQNDNESNTDNNKKTKKKKKSSKNNNKKQKTTIFATNRITSSRVRQAKFASKSSHDMECIFGKDYSTAEIASQSLLTTRKISSSSSSSKLEAKQVRKEERRRKRQEKKKKAAAAAPNNEEWLIDSTPRCILWRTAIYLFFPISRLLLFSALHMSSIRGSLILSITNSNHSIGNL